MSFTANRKKLAILASSLATKFSEAQTLPAINTDMGIPEIITRPIGEVPDTLTPNGDVLGELVDTLTPNGDILGEVVDFITPDFGIFSNFGPFGKDEDPEVEYELVQGKLPQESLHDLQECQNDDDCVYTNNGYCDCANGGEQVAVHKDKLTDFQNLFKSQEIPCTKRASPIPCDIGGGIKCERSSRKGHCVFQPCDNVLAATECPYGEGARVCMLEACQAQTKFLRPMKTP